MSEGQAKQSVGLAECKPHPEQRNPGARWLGAIPIRRSLAPRKYLATIFRRRWTKVGDVVSEALRPTFYKYAVRAEMWRAFRQKSGLQLDVNAALASVGERVIAFLGPVRDSLSANEGFARVWARGGPWLTELSRRADRDGTSGGRDEAVVENDV